MNEKRLIEIAAEAGRLVREAEQLLGAAAAEAMEADVLARLGAAAAALRVECRDCDGYGTVEGGETLMSKCKKCDGRGWVEKPSAPTPPPPTIRSAVGDGVAAPTTVTLCPHGDAVYWNEYNCVVQCHRCGQQFVSTSELNRLRERLRVAESSDGDGFRRGVAAAAAYLRDPNKKWASTDGAWQAKQETATFLADCVELALADPLGAPRG